MLEAFLLRESNMMAFFKINLLTCLGDNCPVFPRFSFMSLVCLCLSVPTRCLVRTPNLQVKFSTGWAPGCSSYCAW